MRQNARNVGLTFWALILAVLLVGMVALAPAPVSAEDGGGNWAIRDSSGVRMEDSGEGEPVAPAFGSPGGGNILFEQPPSAPSDTWWNGYLSDGGSGALCLEDFWGLTGNIRDIHWYGFSVKASLNCDPTGMEFQIIFYQDTAGLPGAPVAVFSNVTPTITYYDTFPIWGGLSAYRFEVADLGTPVSLIDGWVSIQSTSSPNGCLLYWLTSPTGNANAIQQGGLGNLTDNLAFALTAAPPPPNVKYLHSTGGLFNLTDPIGTQWHELYPVFCREYHLSSWEDNGDGVLSPSDQIDMYEKPDGEVRWYHVDEVTITLYVTPVEMENTWNHDTVPTSQGNKVPRQPMYIELEGGYNASVLMQPVCTQWHEIYPVFCREYHLLDWAETEPNDTLDFCDYILLENKQTGDVTEWHVEDVAVDIIVTIKPPPVGGEAYPVNKISVLAPWIVLAVLMAGGISWLTLRRRKAQS